MTKNKGLSDTLGTLPPLLSLPQVSSESNTGLELARRVPPHSSSCQPSSYAKQVARSLCPRRPFLPFVKTPFGKVSVTPWQFISHYQLLHEPFLLNSQINQ